MSTNKIVARTKEEFMADYVPTYRPIYSTFLGKSQLHTSEVGKAETRRVYAMGDIRTKHYTPKDTEIAQIAIMEKKKTYKKYFLVNQFVQSNFQDREGMEDVVRQVLDEHQLQADEMFLTGEGTANNNVVNNGLFYSSDENYVGITSEEIQSGSGRLGELHDVTIAAAEQSKLVAGQKVIFFYGTGVKPLFNSLYSTTQVAWKKALGEVLGAEFGLSQLPTQATPANTNGFIIANLAQTKLHYTVLPGLLDQGYEAKDMEWWFNFGLGSMSLEVLSKYGVVHQPLTLA